MNFFICPGAQKAGTTRLYDILKFHPEIGLSNKKETKYFLKSKDEIDLQEYFSTYFEEDENKIIYGEVDPEYLSINDVPSKIKTVLGPEVKFVFLLRQPIDRAYSHYWMSYRRGFEMETFEKAIELEEERLKGEEKFAIWHQSFIQRGYYAKQIKNYLNYYPIEQMHFVIFEEFVKNTGQELKKICDFLNINEMQIPEDLESTKSNEGNIPKSDMLRKLHGQPSRLKSILKIVLPHRKLRWWIYPLVEKLNRSNVKYDKLDPKLKSALTKQYYTSDMLELETIIGKNVIAHWVKDDY